MNFPFEKYKFYIDEKNRQVIAVSTYAGKNVKGVAKTNPLDEFDVEKGKQLAAARCGAKIAKRREKRALSKVFIAQKQLDEAREYYQRMTRYYEDSAKEAIRTSGELEAMVNNY